MNKKRKLFYILFTKALSVCRLLFPLLAVIVKRKKKRHDSTSGVKLTEPNKKKAIKKL
jgi:hypothetical protein